MRIKNDCLPNLYSFHCLIRYGTVVNVHVFDLEYNVLSFSVNLVISRPVSIGKTLGNAETTENHRSPLSLAVGYQLELRFIMKTSSQTM